MIRVMLVDGERSFLEDLHGMLKHDMQIQVVGTYTKSVDALKHVAQYQPDCVFLDIEMAGINGLEFAHRLNVSYPSTEVCFITHVNHYAAQAFEVNAIDYLLKPVTVDRLGKTIDKLIQKIQFKKLEAERSCRIQCFGSFEVIIGNNPIKWERTKSRELLAYLLQMEGQWIDKYKICDDLWRTCKPKQAIANLQTVVWSIRKRLREVECDQIVIEYSLDRYRLRIFKVNWDKRELDAAYEKYVKANCLQSGEYFVSLYNGEYLYQEDWLWADLEREHYKIKFNQIVKCFKKIKII